MSCGEIFHSHHWIFSEISFNQMPNYLDNTLGEKVCLNHYARNIWQFIKEIALKKKGICPSSPNLVLLSMLSVFLPTFQCVSVLQIFIQHPFLLDTGKQRIYHSKPDRYSLCIGYLFSPRNCLRKEPNSVPWEIHAFSSHYLGENPHYRNLNLWPSINTVFIVLLGAWLALWYSFNPILV